MKHMSNWRVIEIWFAVVATTSAGFAALGGAPGIATATVLLALSLVPPALVWAFRSSESQPLADAPESRR